MGEKLHHLFHLERGRVVGNLREMASADKPPSDDEGADFPDGCAHYANMCELESPCCKRWYRCHRCHDEDDAAAACGAMDRAAVARVRCVRCGLAQPPAARCASCAVSFGGYACLECKLFREPHPDGIYHCDGCGICRIGRGTGPGGSHWHCNRCRACLPIDVDRAAHLANCLPDATDGDCPICFENLSGSRDPCVPGVECGHYLHRQCLQMYLRSGNYKCPMCTKPFVKLDSSPLAAAAAAAAAAREQQRAPAEVHPDLQAEHLRPVVEYLQGLFPPFDLWALHTLRMVIWFWRNPRDGLVMFVLAYLTRKVRLEYIGAVLTLGHFVLKYAHDFALAHPELARRQ